MTIGVVDNRNTNYDNNDNNDSDSTTNAVVMLQTSNNQQLHDSTPLKPCTTIRAPPI